LAKRQALASYEGIEKTRHKHDPRFARQVTPPKGKENSERSKALFKARGGTPGTFEGAEKKIKNVPFYGGQTRGEGREAKKRIKGLLPSSRTEERKKQKGLGPLGNAKIQDVEHSAINPGKKKREGKDGLSETTKNGY